MTFVGFCAVVFVLRPREDQEEKSGHPHRSTVTVTSKSALKALAAASQSGCRCSPLAVFRARKSGSGRARSLQSASSHTTAYILARFLRIMSWRLPPRCLRSTRVVTRIRGMELSWKHLRSTQSENRDVWTPLRSRQPGARSWGLSVFLLTLEEFFCRPKQKHSPAFRSSRYLKAIPIRLSVRHITWHGCWRDPRRSQVRIRPEYRADWRRRDMRPHSERFRTVQSMPAVRLIEILPAFRTRCRCVFLFSVMGKTPGRSHLTAREINNLEMPD